MNKDIGKPNVYSGMKILHHEERFRQWLQYEFEMDKTGESDNMIYPIMVEMHLNTRACNHNCFLEDIRGCGGNWPIKNTQWTRQEGLNFLNQLKTAEVKSIPFSGGGEPMFHPNFDEFLSEASTFADVGLITHGGRIDSFSRAKSIVEKATWVRVSIGGATEETYRGDTELEEQKFKTAGGD